MKEGTKLREALGLPEETHPLIDEYVKLLEKYITGSYVTWFNNQEAMINHIDHTGGYAMGFTKEELIQRMNDGYRIGFGSFQNVIAEGKVNIGISTVPLFVTNNYPLGSFNIDEPNLIFKDETDQWENIMKKRREQNE
jgi:hypothetical protein